MSRHVDELIVRYPVLECARASMENAIEMLTECYRSGGKVMTAGNGGSAADAEHITGELLKGFVKHRGLDYRARERFRETWGGQADELAEKLQGGLPAVNLGGAPALLSAFANDVAPDAALAQHLWALGKTGDVLIGISTGGGAKNIQLALMAARVRGVKTILLTGGKHGVCESYADLVIAAPERETYRIQELHLPLYHTLCLAVEEAFFHE